MDPQSFVIIEKALAYSKNTFKQHPNVLAQLNMATEQLEEAKQFAYYRREKQVRCGSITVLHRQEKTW
ncbi:hypothetical protein [Bacillus fonticola]|uniref:hypothetical protein n=1 Tax=Bacillus fonticola TaxID=2728853 RepID=UPI00147559F8|nr:hypothetical protein [Bacillus fonticola]